MKHFKVFYTLFWRWSWLISLPIFLLFSFWLVLVINHYMTFSIRYNSKPFKVTLYQTGIEQANQLLYQFFTYTDINSPRRKLNTVELFIADAAINKLNSNLPHSGYEYEKAALLNNGKIQKVKIKYRGDYVYHWTRNKKSIRVKTKKNKLYHGLREFNLIAPKFAAQLHNYAAYQLAEQMGLITPRSDIVDVYINGKYHGFHTLVEQLDEITLRRYGVMPGDVYSGEMLAKDKIYGLSGTLFQQPYAWKKIAVNNHYPEESIKPLKRFLELVQADDTEENQQQMLDMMDIEAWGKFTAFELLSLTRHYDNTHNWRLYYDPATSKIIPIAWDPVGWASWGLKDIETMDILPTRLHRKIHKNYQLILAKQKVLVDFFNNNGDDVFIKKINTMVKKLKPSVMTDPNLSPPNPGKVLNKIERYKKFISGNLRHAKHTYLSSADSLFYKKRKDGIIVQNQGRMAIKEIVFSYEKSIKQLPTVSIQYYSGQRLVQQDISSAIHVSNNRLTIQQNLLPWFIPVTIKNKPRNAQSQLYYEAANYLIKLDFFNENQLSNVHAVLLNNDKIPGIESKQVLDIQANQIEAFNVLENNYSSKPIVWQGDIFINKDSNIYQAVIIKPGTHVFLAPKTLLRFYGKVTAVGDVQQPIVFTSIPSISKDVKQVPWGAVVLKDQGANGSIFEHCKFSHGSGVKTDFYEYSAMFSIHNVENVSVKNAYFSNNHLVDDMVHVVYASVSFENSKFNNAHLDALDADISQIRVKDCHFTNTGNDALDLMTTQALVLNTRIEDSIDKGISVGEDSQLLAINNYLRNNNIAIQSKDGSIASVFNTDFNNNNKALDAYKKNWRYNSGGSIYVYKSKIHQSKNAIDITADKNSRIILDDNYLDRSIITTRQLQIHANNNNRNKVQSNKLLRNKNEQQTMSSIEFLVPYWNNINSQIRGESGIH